MTDNPNEYNDTAYLRISETMAYDAAISRYVSELWMAGATASDIKSEFEQAIENAIDEIAPSESKHKGGGPKGKKVKKPDTVQNEYTGERSQDG